MSLRDLEAVARLQRNGLLGQLADGPADGDLGVADVAGVVDHWLVQRLPLALTSNFVSVTGVPSKNAATFQSPKGGLPSKLRTSHTA